MEPDVGPDVSNELIAHSLSLLALKTTNKFTNLCSLSRLPNHVCKKRYYVFLFMTSF